MTNVVILNGTNAPTSRVNAVVKYIEQQTAATTINVFELPAEDLILANWNSEAIKAANKLVEAAELVVVISPVYKASYTGILKTYLDLLPQKAFTNKTLLPIMVGGSEHHLLAIEYALKPVLSALDAQHILQGVYIRDKQLQYNAPNFEIEADVIERLNAQLQVPQQAVTV